MMNVVHGTVAGKSIIPETLAFQGAFANNNPFTKMPSNPSVFSIVSRFRVPPEGWVNDGFFGYYGYVPGAGASFPFAGFYHAAGTGTSGGNIQGRTNVPSSLFTNLATSIVADMDFTADIVVENNVARFYLDAVLKGTRTLATGTNFVFTSDMRGFSPNSYIDSNNAATELLLGYGSIIDQALTAAQLVALKANYLELEAYEQKMVTAYFGNDSITDVQGNKRPINRVV